MKNHLLMCAGCLLLISCSYLRPELPGSRPRHDTAHRNSRQDRDTVASIPRLDRDTVLRFSAVVFPESYDWVRDSAYGLAPFELVLYRDHSPELRISSASAPVSANPDTHHILEGELYSECHRDAQTILCRNGKELLRFDGEDILKGLLMTEEGLYTLYQKEGGEGFSLRRGSEILLARSEGRLFGDFGDHSYGQSGALYKDRGQICFCYYLSSEKSWHHVISGKEGTAVPKQDGVQDMKIIEGDVRFAYDKYGDCELEDARLWPIGYSHRISGTRTGLLSEPICSVILEDESSGRYRQICPVAGDAMLGSSSTWVICRDGQGCARVYDSAEGLWSDYPGMLLMSRSAAWLDANTLSLGLSSRTGGSAMIICGKRSFELDIHGYVSCISTEISLPS